MNKALSIILVLSFFNCSSEEYRISDSEIADIYNKFIESKMTKEYMQRYVPLPLHKNISPWRWEGKDVPRVIALLEFERFVKENNLSCEKGLAINAIDPEWFYLPSKKIVTVTYEDDRINHDLYTLDLNDKDFDFVMINQTLEHVYDPIRCLKNIYKHLREGAILYLNVPANNIMHSLPLNFYTGYTPIGLGIIVRAAGFKILDIGQWGNLEYIKKMYELYDWPDYRQFDKPGLNDMRRPVVTWIFAVK